MRSNNYILFLIKEALQANESEILRLYHLIDPEITIEDVQDVLKRHTEEGYVELSDAGLLMFLEALIIDKRGSNNPQLNSDELTNNMIIKKVRIAFNLHDSDIIEIFAKSGKTLKRSEFTPYFRSASHKQYRALSNSKLSHFLRGLKLYLELR